MFVPPFHTLPLKQKKEILRLYKFTERLVHHNSYSEAEMVMWVCYAYILGEPYIREIDDET